MWARPHGDEFYRWALKASTTTSMTPDEVHAMGQSELKQLHAQMDTILKGLGFTQGHRRRADEGAGQGSPKYQFAEGDKGRAEILAFIQDRLTWIRAQLPRAFNTLVNPNMEVKRLPPEEEPGAPDRVRRRRIDRRQDPGPLLDQPARRPTCTASTAWRIWRSTNRFPATSGRANTPTRCR